jgi:hypothetical protein
VAEVPSTKAAKAAAPAAGVSEASR